MTPLQLPYFLCSYLLFSHLFYFIFFPIIPYFLCYCHISFFSFFFYFSPISPHTPSSLFPLLLLHYFSFIPYISISIFILPLPMLTLSFHIPLHIFPPLKGHSHWGGGYYFHAPSLLFAHSSPFPPFPLLFSLHYSPIFTSLLPILPLSFHTQSSSFLFSSCVFTRGGVLELVDAVQARHVTLVISTYYTVVAEPYFIGFHSA